MKNRLTRFFATLMCLMLISTPHHASSQETAHFIHPGTFLLPPSYTAPDPNYPYWGANRAYFYEVRSFSLSPDGRFVAAIASQEYSDTDFSVLVWDVEGELESSILPTWERVFVTPEVTINDIDVRIAPDSQSIAVVLPEQIQILRLPQLETVAVLDYPSMTLYSSSVWSSDGTIFAVGGDDSLLAWNVGNDLTYHYTLSEPFERGMLVASGDNWVYTPNNCDLNPSGSFCFYRDMRNMLVCDQELEHCQLFEEVGETILPSQDELVIFTQSEIGGGDAFSTARWESINTTCCDLYPEEIDFGGRLKGGSVVNRYLFVYALDQQTTTIMDLHTLQPVMTGLPSVRSYVFLSNDVFVFAQSNILLQLYQVGNEEVVDVIDYADHPLWTDLEEYFIPEAFQVLGAENHVVVRLGNFAILYEVEY